MNKNLTVNSLAIETLKARKKQYTIMIIGIIFSMLFSSCVVFSASAALSSYKSLSQRKFGNQQALCIDAEKAFFREAAERKIVKKYGFAHIIGEAFSTEKDNYNSTLVAYLDENAYELFAPDLIKGKYPTKENEIAIEAISLSKMNIDADIGDEITFDFHIQNGKETFENSNLKKYKLVGILDNRAWNIKYQHSKIIPSAYVYSGAQVELGGKEGLICYFDLIDGGFYLNGLSPIKIKGGNFEGYKRYTVSGALERFRDFYKSYYNIDNDYDFYNIVNFFSYSSGYLDSQENNLIFELVFLIIIIFVVMLASCLSVISAFTSNLNDRKKQIGMLRAVGATKRQIREIYLREALILCLISIPVSMTVAFFAIKLVIAALGDGYSFNPKWYEFLVTVLFSIACVMLSSLICVNKASKTAPMQAIRNIENTRRMNKKKIRSEKNFKVSALIAKRNTIFYKDKKMAVTFILIIAIVFSGYSASYYTYASRHIDKTAYDYAIYAYSDTWYSEHINVSTNNVGFSQSDLTEAQSNEYISMTNAVKGGFVNLAISPDYSQYRERVIRHDVDSYRKRNNETVAQILGFDACTSASIVSADSEFLNGFQKYVWDGKIDTAKLDAGQEIILVAPKSAEKIHLNEDGSTFTDGAEPVTDNTSSELLCDFNVGDEIEIGSITVNTPEDIIYAGDDEPLISNISNPQITKRTVKIGAIIDSKDCFESRTFINNYDFYIITSNRGMESFINFLKYNYICFSLNEPCTNEIEKSVQSHLHSITSKYENGYVESNYGYEQMQRQDTIKVLLTSSAISILVFMVSLSIVNNTVTNNIRNSKRKIGTLRAVGANERVLTKAYMKQTISMLSGGIICGFGIFTLSYIVIALLFKKASSPYSVLRLNYNPLLAIVFTLFVIVVCSFNLWLNLRKEMKCSIVDNIREL